MIRTLFFAVIAFFLLLLYFTKKDCGSILHNNKKKYWNVFRHDTLYWCELFTKDGYYEVFYVNNDSVMKRALSDVISENSYKLINCNTLYANGRHHIIMELTDKKMVLRQLPDNNLACDTLVYIERKGDVKIHYSDD